ncbi:MAG TPA: hypothetical protein PKD79_03070 [Candidatus Doudnabacteria bacterium]|nr:hypothetical protein [Candidatus Doudnabacteria bacterium]
MAQLPEYKKFISEFVRKQMIMLGPDLAVSTANKTTGLEVDQRGAVINIAGDPVLILKNLFNEFLKLTPQLTNYIAHLFFTKYPGIAEEYNEPLSRPQLVCALIKSKA